MTTENSLCLADLENVYDALANAIDKVGSEKANLFLVKLALLNANALGNIDLFETHLHAASQDL